MIPQTMMLEYDEGTDSYCRAGEAGGFLCYDVIAKIYDWGDHPPYPYIQVTVRDGFHSDPPGARIMGVGGGVGVNIVIIRAPGAGPDEYQAHEIYLNAYTELQRLLSPPRTLYVDIEAHSPPTQE